MVSLSATPQHEPNGLPPFIAELHDSRTEFHILGELCGEQVSEALTGGVPAPHPVAARISSHFSPAIIAWLDAHYEELISGLDMASRLGARHYHDQLVAKLPKMVEGAVSSGLATDGRRTVEEILERLWPPTPNQ